MLQAWPCMRWAILPNLSCPAAQRPGVLVAENSHAIGEASFTNQASPTGETVQLTVNIANGQCCGSGRLGASSWAVAL